MAAGLYVAHVAVAVAVAWPVYEVLQSSIGVSGFGPELVRRFDLVLWADAWPALRDGMRAIAGRLTVAVLLWWVWAVLWRVGVAYALSGPGGGDRSFGRGLRRHGLRALGVGALFALAGLGWSAAVGAFAFVADAWVEGEVATFWVLSVGGLGLWLGGLVVLDAAHDYARAALVVRGVGVWRACLAGWRALGSVTAVGVYGFWLMAGAALWLAPTLVEATGAVTTAAGIWGVFAVQQVAIFLRVVVGMSWIGSEVVITEVADAVGA